MGNEIATEQSKVYNIEVSFLKCNSCKIKIPIDQIESHICTNIDQTPIKIETRKEVKKKKKSAKNNL